MQIKLGAAVEKFSVWWCKKTFLILNLEQLLYSKKT